MAWIQADIDALKVAIATGAETVHYADGRSVTYRSLDEMRAILAMMQGEVATTAGTPVPQRFVVGTRRGLYPCTSRYAGWYR